MRFLISEAPLYVNSPWQPDPQVKCLLWEQLVLARMKEGSSDESDGGDARNGEAQGGGGELGGDGSLIEAWN